MKPKLIYVYFFLLAFSLSASAQITNTPKKIIYKYTFQGMKDSTEIQALNKAVSVLKNVTSSNVVFKSAEHAYALLKVEVDVPAEFNENSKDVTGPSDLKKLLSRLGYIPAECKTIYEN